MMGRNSYLTIGGGALKPKKCDLREKGKARSLHLLHTYHRLT